MQSLGVVAVLVTSTVLAGRPQDECPPMDDLILEFPALSRNPTTGELIGVGEVTSSFQAAKDHMAQLQQQEPTCCVFSLPGHWQTLLVGLQWVLTQAAAEKLQLGIQSTAFRKQFDITTHGAHSDCNTIAIDPDLIAGEVPTPDQIAVYWHESQHAHHNPSGQLNDCDHAELYAATLLIMQCLQDCGYGHYNKDNYDALKHHEKELREKCNH